MQALESRPGPIRIYRRMEPFVPMSVENSRYLLKTVDQTSELKEVMQLRARVFSAEYGAKSASGGLDIDPFDFHCDHLVIVEKSSGTIIGTYRVLCSRFTANFYSETEFELGDFLRAPGTKIELGRACIEPAHRRGIVLSLLWRGILRYALETRADYLFGCSSIKTIDPAEARLLHDQLAGAGSVSTEWKVDPVEKHRINGFASIRPKEGVPTAEIPPLLQSYLNAGAKILGEPALDLDFRCVDLLTVLKLTDLNRTHEKFHQI